MTTERPPIAEPTGFERQHFDEILSKLRRDLVELGGLVTENVKRAGHAMVERRLDLIDQVRTADQEVDRRHTEIEKEVFSIIALQQPYAGDLRLLVASTRIVYELERSGDLAVNCVNALERVEGFPDSPRVIGRLSAIVDASSALFARGIDAIADLQPDAGAVLDAADDHVDDLVSDYYTEIGKVSEELGLDAAIAMMRVGRFLERIADHAVNIGEQITYAVTAQMPVQH